MLGAAAAGAPRLATGAEPTPASELLDVLVYLVRVLR